MKTAVPLQITKKDLAIIRRLATQAPGSPVHENQLRTAINSLPADERFELLALAMLGRGGHRSFNVALSKARKQPADRIGEMLAEKTNLAKILSQGLRRYSRQSESAYS